MCQFKAADVWRMVHWSQPFWMAILFAFQHFPKPIYLIFKVNALYKMNFLVLGCGAFVPWHWKLLHIIEFSCWMDLSAGRRRYLQSCNHCSPICILTILLSPIQYLRANASILQLVLMGDGYNIRAYNKWIFETVCNPLFICKYCE